MKIVFQEPEKILIESMGNKLSIVDVPALERQALLRTESRKARKIAEKELFDLKDELLAKEFDVQEYCRSWWQEHCNSLQGDIDLYLYMTSESSSHKVAFDAKVLAQKEKTLNSALAFFNQPNMAWATFYAQKNNGEKPIQNYYEKELRGLADTYALLAIRANFVRDENGKPIFNNNADPVGDYTQEKWDVIKLLQLDIELSEMVSKVTSEGLGFIRKQNAEKENTIGETSSQSQNTAGME